MIKRRFKEYFSFTQKERKGIIVLITIVVIIIAFKFILLNQANSEIEILNVEYSLKAKTFEESLVLKEQENKKKYSKNSKIQDWKVPENLFNFDPNITTDEEFLMLGFSQYQVKTICNYRNKGGKFYKKTDLLKIYGISKDQYKILEDYIFINSQAFNISDSVYNKLEKQHLIKIIEINSATDSELVFLSGIGKTYSYKITKYRNRLGGFVNKEQLLEISGMDTTRYNQFVNQIIIDTTLVVKININNAEYKELIKHPYFNKYQVQSILKYRELNGNFKFTDELVKNNLLTNDVYVKLKPYIDIK